MPASVLLPPNGVYPEIRAIRLRIETLWQRPTSIPGPVLANVLRGAIGLTLRRLVCPEQWQDNDCRSCPLRHECPYGRIFSPSPPFDAGQLRRQQDLPRPFVIEPPGLHPEDRVTTEGLTFRLMLFGTAIDSLPYLISTLERLGADGLGRDRVPFTMEKITTCHPAGEESLFTAGSNRVTLPQQIISTQDLLNGEWGVERQPTPTSQEIRRRVLARMGVEQTEERRTTANDSPQLRIRFLTPLLLKTGSGLDEEGARTSAQEIRERPPFGVIIRRLRDRLSSLCTFFGERWDCPDFAGLGQLADRVTISSSQTTWLTRSRTSTRTGHSHEISGLVGSTTYSFPDETTLQALTPLLKIGELIHVGKNAPWGNGSFQVRHTERTCDV